MGTPIGGVGHQSVLSWIGWLCDSLGRAGSSCCHMMQHLKMLLLSHTMTLLLVPCQPHTQGVAGARRCDESGEPVAIHKTLLQGYAEAGRGGEHGEPVAIHKDPVVKGLLWQGAAVSPENLSLYRNPVIKSLLWQGAAASPENLLLYTKPACKGMLWQGAAISPDNLSLYERWAGVGGAGGAHVELGGKGEGDGARLLGDSGMRAG